MYIKKIWKRHIVQEMYPFSKVILRKLISEQFQENSSSSYTIREIISTKKLSYALRAKFQSLTYPTILCLSVVVVMSNVT